MPGYDAGLTLRGEVLEIRQKNLAETPNYNILLIINNQYKIIQSIHGTIACKCT